jgi:hypothetical protein
MEDVILEIISTLAIAFLAYRVRKTQHKQNHTHSLVEKL